MKRFVGILVAFSLLGPAQSFAGQSLTRLQVGDDLRLDESISIGSRAIRLPQAGWHLLATRRSENRIIGGTGTTEVTSGVFAYINGTRTLAVVYFSASEATLPNTRWTTYNDCETTPVRFVDRFGSPPAHPECHEVRLMQNFLGSTVRDIWADARRRLSELGAGWSGKQLYSQYFHFPWGDTFNFAIYVSPRLFSPKGSTAALDSNDDIPQAFVDWSKKQVAQLRLLAKKNIETFLLDDLPKPEETAVANLPATQVRPARTDTGSVADNGKFPCATERCVGVLKRYLDRPWPRALVVAKEGAYAYWSGEDPLAHAMDMCKRQTKLPDTCRFYAVNDEIVWNP